jgi:hypothetical protein
MFLKAGDGVWADASDKEQTVAGRVQNLKPWPRV